MRVPGAPPRPARLLLKELDSLLDEIAELASKDSKFRTFFFSQRRYPVRILGFSGTHQPLTKTMEEWENVRSG
jgi:hypothetical protein